MLKKIICLIKGHNLIEAGACPFTGKSYDLCKRCTKMIQTSP
jgi:hypothetical protein